MKKAFTLMEVIILLVIFILVAILVIPLSIDETIQARLVSKWKHAQINLTEIPISVKMLSNKDIELQTFVSALVKSYPLNKVISYNIRYMNGEKVDNDYKFEEKYITDNGAVVAFKWFDTPKIESKTNREILGILMYDVNGKQKPNLWGKDAYGMNIYKDSVEPFGKNINNKDVEFDCSRQGRGLYCSSYYLNGGDF